MSDIQARMELLMESYMLLDKQCEELQDQVILNQKYERLTLAKSKLEDQVRDQIALWQKMLEELQTHMLENINQSFQKFEQSFKVERDNLAIVEIEGLKHATTIREMLNDYTSKIEKNP